jgi:nitrogen regulatory protein P-II 1
MKEIRAIIQPHMLNKVIAALHALPHFPGMTISDCQGQGRGRGKGGHYDGSSPDSVFLAKRVKLEVLCSDAICDELVRVIQTASHTGNPGDGIVIVSDPLRVVRIRTGQEQDDAV